MYTKDKSPLNQAQIMAEIPIYWRAGEEDYLASFQGDQGSSNHCAKYAAASAIQMLTGLEARGIELVDWLEERLLKGTLRYTIFGNHNGSLVFQTANQIRRLALLHGIRLSVRCRRGSAADLKLSLQDGGVVTLVSITYFQGEEPQVSRGRGTHSSLAGARWIGGHVMILAANDPGHQNYAGVSTPWGFISSWGSPDQLYWMTDADFQRTWGRLSILNMITVKMG